MHQFIALLLLYLHQKIKCTFSVILDTVTIPSNIVRLERSGQRGAAHAIPRTVLVSPIIRLSESSDLLFQTMPLILVFSALRICSHESWDWRRLVLMLSGWASWTCRRPACIFNSRLLFVCIFFYWLSSSLKCIYLKQSELELIKRFRSKSGYR